MELIEYLSEYFLPREILLEQSDVTASQLTQYQKQGLMPKASYTLKLTTECNSFLGEYSEASYLEFYAKGYVGWLNTVQAIPDAEAAYALFAERYKATLGLLNQLGHSLNYPKLTSELDAHLNSEWQHFLDGTYGLCTKSGLPEDIAAKELAILEINALISQNELSLEQTQQLARAVNLLDKASALFAPHERAKSSRKRLIDDVRERYLNI